MPQHRARSSARLGKLLQARASLRARMQSASAPEGVAAEVLVAHRSRPAAHSSQAPVEAVADAAVRTGKARAARLARRRGDQGRVGEAKAEADTVADPHPFTRQVLQGQHHVHQGRAVRIALPVASVSSTLGTQFARTPKEGAQ